MFFRKIKSYSSRKAENKKPPFGVASFFVLGWHGIADNPRFFRSISFSAVPTWDPNGDSRSFSHFASDVEFDLVVGQQFLGGG